MPGDEKMVTESPGQKYTESGSATAGLTLTRQVSLAVHPSEFIAQSQNVPGAFTTKYGRREPVDHRWKGNPEGAYRVSEPPMQRVKESGNERGTGVLMTTDVVSLILQPSMVVVVAE
jgi:hypothetical protein